MNKQSKNELSRRVFLGSAATVAALSVVPLSYSCSPSESSSGTSQDPVADGKPSSKFAGVQCGTITYSFRGVDGVDATIAACVEAGVSSIELMGNGLEEAIGAPSNPVQRGFGGPPPGGAPGGAGMPAAQQPGAGGRPMRMQRPEPEPLTEEEQALQDKYNEELAAFRNDPNILDKWATLKKKFDDAGIDIHILKWTAGDTDEELDYSFQVAKTMGAVGITTELSEESCQTLGVAAERNGMLAIYHNHGQYAEMTVVEIEKWLAYSAANRLNFDCGHYFGSGYKDSTGLSPIEFIDHFHDRIVSVHCKDKTAVDNQTISNTNQVWGQGETPLREILQHVRDNYPHLYCDVELEYDVKAWSDSAKEVGKCIRYMREALI